MFAIHLSHPICSYGVLATCLGDGSGARLLSAQFGRLSPLSAPETIRLLLSCSSSMVMAFGHSSGFLLVKNAAPLLWSMMSSWLLIAVLFAAALMVIVSNPVHATLTCQDCCEDKALAVSNVDCTCFTITRFQLSVKLKSIVLALLQQDLYYMQVLTSCFSYAFI
ncbi:hypothetical protein MIR68_000310 [Amoeboaphelidium protococcarum]|nr:hypothetical protein MIR68_009984 [Amoeboaphelidium protococcarum]KAI3632155.1 hypothetical protein MIR68_009991 [Amoeboaphelidium protococcarum]KAI3641655.1 hypothetical protein MIR68_000310 [Amoeboaphelidium protococcarum]